MRWGAASETGADLSHIWIDQFTYWDSVKAHEDFHETFEDVVVDSCAKCGSVLLDGSVVRSGAIIGAGSLVPPGKELEGGYLWLGSPVKRVRELTEKEKAFLEYSASHYVYLKNRHKA